MAPRARDKLGFRRFYLFCEEVALLDPFREILRLHAVSLWDVYGDVPGPSVHAARMHLWWWLSAAYGKSAGEIGRIFDRDGSSIHHAVAKLRARAKKEGVLVSEETAAPLARLVAFGRPESAARARREIASTQTTRHNAIDDRDDPEGL